MSLKKLLGIISIVIIVVFSMMLTTSYAWYSFENASTVFEGVTSNDDIIINYQHGEYISTDKAVPISESEIDKYSEKNDFSILVKKNARSSELAVTISLVDIVIDGSLQNANFIVELYYQGEIFKYNQDGDPTLEEAKYAGNSIGVSGATTKTLGTVTLDNEMSNNFEVRVYLLDDGTDQSSLENKSFRAKIQINVVSRLKTNVNKDPDIYVSAITIDNVASDSLPTSGHYDMTASCVKGSNLTWDKLSKTITYTSGSYVSDTCSLTFTSNTNYPLLNTMAEGSYVAYTGNNGCTGKSCEGRNVNYESEAKMGYCSYINYQFHTNGWRIGYIQDGIVYLISAGATDCVATNAEGVVSSTRYEEGNNVSSADRLKHLNNLNEAALKYCNSAFAYGGICDSTNTWAMNITDFEIITGNPIVWQGSCNQSYSDVGCGYNNDLIDNGGYYWLANTLTNSSRYTYNWNGFYRFVYNAQSRSSHGVRPVLKLDTAIVVTGGAGTYEDPYLIKTNVEGSFTINNGAQYVNSNDTISLSLQSSDTSVTMCVSVDTTECTNYVAFSNTYTLDLSSEPDGEKVVYVYYKDSSGQIVTSMSQSIIIDTVAPTDNSVTISSGTTLSRTLTLSSTGASHMCIINTNPLLEDNIDVSNCTWLNYATTYEWTLTTGTGNKEVSVIFKDQAGNVSDVVSATTTVTSSTITS